MNWKYFISKDFLYPIIMVFMIIILISIGEIFGVMMEQEILARCGSTAVIDSTSTIMGVQWHHEINSTAINISNWTIP